MFYLKVNDKRFVFLNYILLSDYVIFGYIGISFLMIILIYFWNLVIIFLLYLWLKVGNFENNILYSCVNVD